LWECSKAPRYRQRIGKRAVEGVKTRECGEVSTMGAPENWFEVIIIMPPNLYNPDSS
jgi:hypothetical protein